MPFTRISLIRAQRVYAKGSSVQLRAYSCLIGYPGIETSVLSLAITLINKPYHLVPPLIVISLNAIEACYKKFFIHKEEKTIIFCPISSPQEDICYSNAQPATIQFSSAEAELFGPSFGCGRGGWDRRVGWFKGKKRRLEVEWVR